MDTKQCVKMLEEKIEGYVRRLSDEMAYIVAIVETEPIIRNLAGHALSYNDESHHAVAQDVASQAYEYVEDIYRSGLDVVDAETLTYSDDEDTSDEENIRLRCIDASRHVNDVCFRPVDAMNLNTCRLLASEPLTQERLKSLYMVLVIWDTMTLDYQGFNLYGEVVKQLVD